MNGWFSMKWVQGAGCCGAIALALTAPPGWGAKASPAVTGGPSVTNGLEIQMLQKLPAAPAPTKAPARCAQYVVTPTTQPGKAVASAGWVITAEAQLGPFEAISFAGQLRPVGDGYDGNYCTVEQGNVGIFQDGDLVAIAYASPSAKTSIGKAVALEGGGVRLWSGRAISQPIGDINVADNGRLVQLDAVAAQEMLCSGRATVPNIYGMPIDKARRMLITSGWTPMPRKGEDGPPSPGQEKQLVERGVVEVSACSEGLDYCGFGYRHGAVGLSVTTMGDDPFPKVTGYGADCP
jgi:hypothetical protein